MTKRLIERLAEWDRRTVLARWFEHVRRLEALRAGRPVIRPRVVH